MNMNISSIKELLHAGGPVLIILLLISIYSFALILERWFYYKRKVISVSNLVKKIRKPLQEGDRKEALNICLKSQSLAGNILANVIKGSARRIDKDQIISSIEWTTLSLQKHLGFLATVGTTSPYIGLFGTVLGVIRAFHDLSVYSSAGPSVVAAGISEALINTAAGLFAAIPAVMAYNYFVNKSNRFAKELEWAVEKIIAGHGTIEPPPPPPKVQ
jgi:biopolymer transport protein TolQ